LEREGTFSRRGEEARPRFLHKKEAKPERKGGVGRTPVHGGLEVKKT